jgi:Tol biopolymer transport system component
MRRNRIGAVVVSVVLATGSLVARQAPTGNGDVEVMLEAAMHTEQVEGRLKDAIERYRVIATRAAAMTPARKDVAATALLQMARSQEKLGQPEARATYQRIVREYPDQPTAVAAARARVGRTQAEITPRRVLDGAYASIFDVSADGRWTVGPQRVGFSGYDIVRRDAITGQSTVLVPASPAGSSFHARLSDDGTRLAYQWSSGEPAVYSLRIAQAVPGATPLIIPSASPIIPLDWSPDGSAVLTISRRYDGQQLQGADLGWVTTGDQVARTLKTFAPWQMAINDARISPDGKSVAFTARPTAGSTDRYLYLLDVATGAETALVTTAGSRLDPTWMPDGRTLLFVSEGGDRRSLMAVRIDGGRSAGEPWTVHADLGGSVVGVTKAGTLYYSRSTGGGNYEYILPRNPSPNDRPLHFEGLSGTFSPDGQSLAFIRNRVLIVRGIETGQERSFRRDGLTVVSPRWLHDNTGVIVTVDDEAGGRSVRTFYLVDIRSGEFRRLFERDNNGRFRTEAGALAHDNRTLYLGARTAPSAPVTAIVGVDIMTGEERTIVTIEGGLPQSQPGIALSPEGKTLAVYGWTRPSEEARIFTVGVDGTGYRNIVPSVRTGSPADTVRWTPDGRSLVFVAHDANRNWRVMRVPADGGPIEFDGLSFDTLSPLLTNLKLFPGNFNNIDLHPDGTRIVASTLTMSSQELWTLDNLMWVLNQR